MQTFKLGIDWHGVLDAIPEEMAWLSRAICSSGGEVHIITGMSWNEDCEKQLRAWNIEWTHHFSIIDYHIENKTPQSGWHEKFNMPAISDEYWDRTKADYCRKHNISLHLDDTLIYGEYFTTPFGRIWTKNGKNKGGHKQERHLK